jgi:hypothetical protein
METEHKTPSCTLCSKVPNTPCDDKTTEEFVVIDYRIKSANHIGFPSGEKHTVQGWKIKHNRTIHTYVCGECADKYLTKIKQHAPRNAIISGAVTLFFVIIFIYMLTIEVGNEYGGYGLLVILLFMISLFVFGFFMNRVFADKSQSNNTLQKRALKKLLGASLNLKYSQPENFPRLKGLLFHIASTDWQNLEKRLGEIESKTSWSYIHYLRESTLGSPQICTLEEGATYKKVEHLGLYLGLPDESPAVKS